MWVQIAGFPDYSVSDQGEVRHESNLRPLAVTVNQRGVPYVGLVRHSEQKKRSLARLVANAFLPQDLESFDTPINLDGDRLNCAMWNLMWRPRWFAIRYNQQFRDPYRNRVNRPLRAVDFKEVHSSSIEAACRYGLLERDIVLSLHNHTWCWPTYQYFELVE